MMPARVPDDFDQFDATLSLVDPLKDYEQLMDEKFKVDAIVDDEMLSNIWNKISAGASDALWKLMFDNDNFSDDHWEKISILLQTYKADACFYSPWVYNDWIILIRDELLKREMFDFWKNIVVAKELGPAWARDSDLFDDMDDPEPANFYKFAGCELKEKKNTSTLNRIQPSTAVNSPNSTKVLKKISKETPVEDYKYNMEAQNSINADDDEAFRKIFAEVREIVWKLLFAETTLTADNSEKAAALLGTYKSDACVYSPHDYNDWIPMVRDELFERKYFDFWQNIIVKEELGLCWAKDSDCFDNLEDPKPMAFYNAGDGLLSGQQSK